MRLSPLAALLSVAIVGCSSSSAVEKPAAGAKPDNVEDPYIVPPAEMEGSPRCEDVSTDVGVDDDTPLGVEGGELLAALPDRATGAVFWLEQEGEVEVEAGLDFRATADERSLRFIESTAVYPESGPGLGIVCSNSLAVEGVLTLKTDDGRLELSLPTTFFLSADDVARRRVTFSVDLDGVTLGPDFRLEDVVDTSRYEDVSLLLSGSLEGGSFEGEIRGVGTYSDGATSGADLFTLATFSAG